MNSRRGFRGALGALLVIAAACNDAGVAPEQPPPEPEIARPGKWTALAPMHGGRSAAGAAAIDGTIYVAGGIPAFGRSAYLTEILAYQPVTNRWRTVGNLLTGVLSPGVAAVGGRVYVVGGFRVELPQAIADLQILDPASGTVVEGPPMPTGRGGAAVVVLDGRIHVIGGERDGRDGNFEGEYLSEHAVFDSVAGAWTSRAPIPAVTELHGAASAGGKIYVAAGPPDHRLYVYDPATDTWAVASANPPRGPWYDRAVAALGGKVYLVGGGNQPQCCSGPMSGVPVFRFDPSSTAWEEVARMPTARSGPAVAVVGDAIYAMGGISTSLRSEGGSSANERFQPE